MRRLLRVIASLALVPVVIFANAGTATAATSGTLVFSLDGGSEGDAHCQIAWGRTATGISIGASSLCQAGPDFSPYSGQAYEDATGSYGIVFRNLTDVTCGSAALPARDIPENTVRSVAAGLGAAFAPISWANCTPNEVCLSYYWDGPGLSGVDTADCVPFPVDPPETGDPNPPVEVQSCPFGTPQSIYEDHYMSYSGGGIEYFKDKYVLGFYARDTLGKSWTLAEREWKLTGVHSPGGTVPAQVAAPSTGLHVPTGSSAYPTETDSTANANNPVWVEDRVWKNNPGPGLGGAHQSGNPPLTMYGVQITNKGSLSSANIPVGYTNPEKCTFWFGPKIRPADHPTFGFATPYGQLRHGTGPTPVPDVPPPTVTPTPTGDVDTNGGFLQGILGVLNKVWNAIKDVVGAIKDLVVGIGNKLKDLFIPDDDEWGVAAIRAQLRDKPPFSVAAELKDQAWSFVGAYTSSSNCGLLSDFTPIAGETTALDCGKIKASPGLGGLYSLVSAGLIGLTAWACFVMVQQVFQDGS